MNRKVIFSTIMALSLLGNISAFAKDVPSVTLPTKVDSSGIEHLLKKNEMKIRKEEKRLAKYQRKLELCVKEEKKPKLQNYIQFIEGKIVMLQEMSQDLRAMLDTQSPST